ncbi:MAG: M48 family metallopeptidase [Leptolyngbyaceae cyanobacterium]
MENLYPAGPASVPPNLSQPKSSYQQRAIAAMAGLLVFVLLYVLLTGWFIQTAYRLLASSFQGGDGAFWGFLASLPAIFLAIFMVKALFRVKHSFQSNDIEVTPKDEPQLFEFLYRIADEAQAPRPHRVFLSPRVNAAVFYDLSILNLIFPSKKNLDIGLGLVNVLTLGELKAVLAHEFGHFGQRSMAVGRWVYVAQQITAHIVAERDILDRFLRGLSRFDIRIAWVGWVLSLIVWSIRSLLETVFQWVVLAQRALSREMEFQADLVAVSLTGSDALVHALHRLHAADDAWERTLSFAQGEWGRDRPVKDLFTVQTKMIERMRGILDDADYGRVQPVPTTAPENHRVFQAELTEPPRMWATHPPNVDREENAKQVYIAAPIDDRPSWVLFQNAEATREKLSIHIFAMAAAQSKPASAKRGAKAAATSTASKKTPVPLAASLQQLEQQFSRLYLDPIYRGNYLGRSVVQAVTKPQELYNDLSAPVDEAQIQQYLADLYPESLTEDLEEIRILTKEKVGLQAIQSRRMDAPGGMIRHRGQTLKRRDLPNMIKQLEQELATVQGRVNAHDRLCRTTHLAIATQLGNGWDDYLRGLAQVLHYADHAEANLRDAQGYVSNVMAVITADRNVSRNELNRLLKAADQLQQPLKQIYQQRDQVQLDAILAKSLNGATWSEILGTCDLATPTQQNISQWLQVIDNWVGGTAGVLSSLKLAALEQLLRSEAILSDAWRNDKPLPPAPSPSQTPTQYPVLLPGQERKRQTRLGLWDRFQTADGWFPGIMRFLVASAVILSVLWAGTAVGSSSVTVYNGLSRPVVVQVGRTEKWVQPYATTTLSLPRSQQPVVETRTVEGQVIETFEADIGASFANYVYNVARATPMVEWTAVYGNASERPERLLGTPRWFQTNADVLFQDPPRSVETSGGGATRDVLVGFADMSPNDVLSLVKNEAEYNAVVTAHARWDTANSPYVLDWLNLAKEQGNVDQIVADRLEANPQDAIALRMEQELATADEYEQVCDRHQALAQAEPDNSDLRSLAARCLSR